MKSVLSRHSKIIFLAAFFLVACAQRNAKPSFVDGSVRMLDRVPVGITCHSLGVISVRDGAGCANVGRNRVGREDILNYNLKQQARHRGANVVIVRDGIREDSFSGCPSYGLVAEAELYTCDFSASR